MTVVYDPGYGQLVGTVRGSSLEDAKRVLATASTMSEVARNLSAYARKMALRQVAERVAQQQNEFAELIASEGIKTIREARREVQRGRIETGYAIISDISALGR